MRIVMEQAGPVTSICASVDGTAIAALNASAHLSIGREVEELLRIRREAEEAVFRLIELLDLDEPDPDLEPYLAGFESTSERELDNSDDEPSLGWTHLLDQSHRKWAGSHWQCEGGVVDGEAEHDGREPDADLELEPDDETGSDGDASDADRNPAYAERLSHRRRSSGGGDRPMRVQEFLDVMDRLSPADKAAAAGRFKREVRS
jgi:hypothetical protein